jgi:hypothetical protein
MRAKRIAPHRKTIFVRRTKCKNFCAPDHTNVYNFVNPKDGRPHWGRARNKIAAP